MFLIKIKKLARSVLNCHTIIVGVQAQPYSHQENNIKNSQRSDTHDNNRVPVESLAFIFLE